MYDYSKTSLEIIGVLIGQPFIKKRSRRYLLKILLGFWLVFEIVICTGYKSTLVSFMTSPKEAKQIETHQQLVKSEAV